MKAWAPLLAALTHLGDAIDVRAARITMNGAVLQANCEGRSPVVLYTNASSDKLTVYPAEGQGSVRVWLGGVAVGCGTEIGTLDTVCAKVADEDTDFFPPTLYCGWYAAEEIVGSATGPVNAHAVANGVGHKVFADCPMPAKADFLRVLGEPYGREVSIRLKLMHFVKRQAFDEVSTSGTLLEYDGPFAGDEIRFALAGPPPPSPPAFPPPPSPPHKVPAKLVDARYDCSSIWSIGNGARLPRVLQRRDARLPRALQRRDACP